MKKLLFAMLLALITINISAASAEIVYRKVKPKFAHYFPDTFFITYPIPGKDAYIAIYKDLNTGKFYIKGGIEQRTATELPRIDINPNNPFSSLKLNVPQIKKNTMYASKYLRAKKMLPKYNKLAKKLINLLKTYERKIKNPKFKGEKTNYGEKKDWENIPLPK